MPHNVGFRSSPQVAVMDGREESPIPTTTTGAGGGDMVGLDKAALKSASPNGTQSNGNDAVEAATGLACLGCCSLGCCFADQCDGCCVGGEGCCEGCCDGCVF